MEEQAGCHLAPLLRADCHAPKARAPEGSGTEPPGSALGPAILTGCFSGWPITPWSAGLASGFIARRHTPGAVDTSRTVPHGRRGTLLGITLKERRKRKGEERKKKKKKRAEETMRQLKVSLLASLKKPSHL